MRWKGVILLIGCVIPVLQAQNLTREEVSMVEEVHRVCLDLNKLVEEQRNRYEEIVRAYDSWSRQMKRDRLILNLKESEPPDWESLRSDVSKARKRWWEVTQKVHKAEERLAVLLDQLFGNPR